MSYSANAIHKKLRTELENYIKSQYFGKSPLLLNALSERLNSEGVIYREPYIESSPAYKSSPNGFETINLPAWLKNFFMRLGAAGLGVYLSPFIHQIQALEFAVAGKDLFVSTGTGSGKTECFLWPLLAKLATEAHDSSETWENRGVRVMIMYPMNALVSDQVSRLRKLLADREKNFIKIFRESCGKNSRRPQFGMYTGRTPYPGKAPDKDQDKKLKATLELITTPENDDDKEFFNKLADEGKLPAKSDMEQFLAKLDKSCHTPDKEDAELITRFEMQHFCPDILITNYSMLEYMLMRPREKKIWADTAAWLNDNLANRLLFVIDEAHMYKGSSGGEVALLIRRLLYKLGISRDKVQFILTTASMPDSGAEDRKAVSDFFKNLTALEDDASFEYLTGEREILPTVCKYDINAEKFLNCNIDKFEGTDESRLNALNKFWENVEGTPEKFFSLQEACAWLYDHLTEYRPFAEMIRQCRGTAVSLNELATTIFPDMQKADALNAVSALLAVAPLARNDKDAVLFPARMHMLFRGIKGVYACTNENCPHAHAENNAYGNLTLGEIFLSSGELVCPHCNSVIHELYNDRRCGALFFKGYIFENEIKNRDKAYLWRYSGQVLDKRMKEIHLFIPPKDYRLDNKQKKSVCPCYLDVKSGFIYFNAALENRDGIRKLYYSEFSPADHPSVFTFNECPHCRHQLSRTQLTSFSTRGNQPFFNLIKTQFQSQPAVPNKNANLKNMPNEGRKVLIFSDSRQRAATLARDMSRTSEDTAARQLFAIAADNMENANADLSLNDFYDYFCLAAGAQNVQLFNGDERENFLTDCKDACYRAERRGKKYRPRLTVERAQSQMKEIVLRFFCSGYNTLYDSAVSWLEPEQEALEDALYKLEDYGIKVSETEFLEIFNAWIISICDKNTALGYNIPDTVRKNVRQYFGKYGLDDTWEFSRDIRDILVWEKDSTAMKNWRRVLQETFLRKNTDSGNLYVKIDCLKARFDLNHEWHRCEKCKEITPYLLKGKCPNCASSATHVLNEDDLEALEFWRKPVKAAINGEKIRIIDTEEHTAQLSHKDQRDNFWSKTESYELRFQNFLRKNELPVDILSSTTTMEVGIDIGSLIAVGLRNIPPMRENYQQRAGRAGRRGTALSTIVTFCEDGPHDTLYFDNPVPMFRGEPRKPWIDVESEKLFQRHLSIILFQDFLSDNAESLDSIPAATFLDNFLDDFKDYATHFNIPENTALIPKNFTPDMQFLRKELFEKLDAMNLKKDRHPEIFGINDNGETTDNAKSLLDSLYEEGIVPTYSFPKNVVSTYIVDKNGNIIYQVERGLDIAISEYAPGRSIVVDKNTYQIGGIYFHGSERKKGQALNPARSFFNDENYVKSLLTCEKCGWFGLAEEGQKNCPFCGNEYLSVAENQMLKPWGFAPRNAESISEAQLTEEYSSTQPPEYSTVPENDEMLPIDFCKNIRMASRKNQRIIMLNKGLYDSGFIVCKDCGAAMPNTKKDPLQYVGRPYKPRFTQAQCKHKETVKVDLGYDFITDMLVLEFTLDNKKIDTRNSNENLWLPRAAQSLAEAFRLVACKELDIDFSELITGYRIRRASKEKKTFVDIYIYDSLSGGAGYSVKIESEIKNLFMQMKEWMSSCSCESACDKCLKHYRNQYIHGRLDRFYGLDLLEWGISGKIPIDIPLNTQRKYLESIKNILLENNFDLKIENEEISLIKNNKVYELNVYPAMWREPKAKNKIFICESYFKYAKPYALDKINILCQHV